MKTPTASAASRHPLSRTRSSSRLLTARRLSGGLMLVALLGACADNESAPGESARVATVQQKVTGNIHPWAVQIDGPAQNPPGADLYADVGTPLNAGATVDWVADRDPNGGTGCLGVDSIASCIEPYVTGAAGGMGHWNGVRVVDGIASGDQDIFLTGGKENDFVTWNIGPGSVGSSKYDIVQAYLANNQSTLFFGMERRGNDGTTAFDFEFNQLAPGADPSCPDSLLIPCRSDDDVLFVFEMQGSGKSGSATPHVFVWKGSEYVPSAADEIVSSINNSMTTAGGPWGHVDSHGNWALGDLDRFVFAEAAAPISLLPGINACGGKAYVQVRTRSSATDTSDLKDTTRVFEFLFMNLSVEAKLTPSCGLSFGFEAAGKDADGSVIENPTCEWTFSDTTSNVATSDLCRDSVLPGEAGTYTGTVKLTDPASGCSLEATTEPVIVAPPLGVTADLTATCESYFTYAATVSGGSNPGGTLCDWEFSGGPVTPVPSTNRVNVGTPAIPYTGVVTCTDPRTDIVCTASASDTATPYAPLAVNLSLDAGGGMCPATDAVKYTAHPSGGNGDYALVWDVTGDGTECSDPENKVWCMVINPDDAMLCADRSLSVRLTDSSGICSLTTSETETYKKETIITASDN